MLTAPFRIKARAGTPVQTYSVRPSEYDADPQGVPQLLTTIVTRGHNRDEGGSFEVKNKLMIYI
jgi:hypothetical protein